MTRLATAEPPSHEELAARINSSARRSQDATLDWVILAVACGILVLAAILDTRGGTQVVIPVLGLPLPELCYARRWLGMECPGCGLTRSFIAMMHGDLADAWRYNAAGFLIFVAVVCQIPYRGWHLSHQRFGTSAPRLAWLAWIWVAIGAALVIQWIARF